MDATAQALATSNGLPGFEGGAEDRAGFLLVCSSRLRIVSVVLDDSRLR